MFLEGRRGPCFNTPPEYLSYIIGRGLPVGVLNAKVPPPYELGRTYFDGRHTHMALPLKRGVFCGIKGAQSDLYYQAAIESRPSKCKKWFIAGVSLSVCTM